MDRYLQVIPNNKKQTEIGNQKVYVLLKVICLITKKLSKSKSVKDYYESLEILLNGLLQLNKLLQLVKISLYHDVCFLFLVLPIIPTKKAILM